MTLEARVVALEAKVELLSASLNRTAQFTVSYTHLTLPTICSV